MRELGECFAKQRCAFDATLANRALFLSAPTPAGNAFAGEMNYRVEAFETFWIDAPEVWMPLDLGRARGAFATHEAHDFMTVFG
jgi:hypothetical protein